MIGHSLSRQEDIALLTGSAVFAGDRAAEAAALVFVRSDVPAGRIDRLDTAEARAMPGVLTVLTAADLKAACITPLGAARAPATAEPPHLPPVPPLASGHVRHIGEAVVAVVAETRGIAEAAAEMVELDVAAAPAVTGLEDTRTAPPVWPAAPGNRVFLHEVGDADGVARVLETAQHVVRQRLAISRVHALSLEPRSALASWDGDEACFVLHAGTQTPHRLRDGLALAMGIETDRLRLVADSCGGSFGMRNAPTPEHVCLLAAARATGRAVAWVETRAEAMLASPHAREQIVDAALALDRDGTLLALQVDIAAAMGAYVGPSTLHPSTGNLPSLSGPYRLPAIHARVEGLHLNTQTMAAYRGAGRPEATFIIERMIDIAAKRLGHDRVELRRRNLIPAQALPWTNPLGHTYDSGDFEGLLDTALDAAAWSGAAQRAVRARARGRIHGIGLACAIEIAGGPARAPAPEYACVDLSPESVRLRLGTGDSGQGHRTAFAQILAAELGLAARDIEVVLGDTGDVARGTGTFGSRSIGAGGTAIAVSAAALRARLLPEAADELEVAAGDVMFEGGAFRVAGTDRRIDVASLVHRRGLTVSEHRMVPATAPSYPNGCHVAEVEIDPETGALDLVGYWAVEDLGTLVNPMLAAGQIHGGVAQGVGQALLEALVHDAESGQLLTGSLMDYALPRASDLPPLHVISRPSATTANALGAKGAGEAGTVGALAAVVNAVGHGLGLAGVDHVPMPATPFAIWSALNAATTSSEVC